MSLLVNNLHEKKHHRQTGQTKFEERARAFCNLHSCHNFALVFSQSEARNYFMCTINKFIALDLLLSI